MSTPIKRQRLDSSEDASIEDEKITEESTRCVTSLDNIPIDTLGTILDFLSLQTICRIHSVSSTFESNAKKALRRFTDIDCGDVVPNASKGEMLSSVEMNVLYGILRIIRDYCPNLETLSLTEYSPNYTDYGNCSHLLTFTDGKEEITSDTVGATDALANLLAELLDNCPHFDHISEFGKFVPPLDIIARTSADTVFAGITKIFLKFVPGSVEMIDLSQMMRKCQNISNIAFGVKFGEPHVKIELAPLLDRYREQLCYVFIGGLEVIDIDAAMAALGKLSNCTDVRLYRLFLSAGGRLQDRHIAMLSPEFLRRLNVLHLRFNDITNATIDYLGRCGMPNLRELFLNGCPEITNEMLLRIVDDTTNFPLLKSLSDLGFEDEG